MLKKSILVFSFSLFIFNSYGQVLNIEKHRLDADTTEDWLGNFAFLLNLQEQQGFISVFDLDANVAKIMDNTAYILIGDLQFINARESSVSSKGFVHGRSVFLRKRKLKPEVFIQAQFDNLRGMKDRQLVGFGPRFTLYRSKKAAFSMGTSLMYEYEVWEFNELKEVTSLTKSSNYISWIISFSDRVGFNGVVYYQVPFHGEFRQRVFTDNYFNFELNKRFSFLVKGNFWYDDNPVVEVKKTAYSFTTGVKLKF